MDRTAFGLFWLLHLCNTFDKSGRIEKRGETMAILRVKDAEGNIYDIPAIKGEKGDKGDKGYTPIKGTDYWTPADKSQMVSDVLNSLPTWNGGSY